MSSLSRADVEHVAYLARLGLSDDELTLLEGQLNHILEQYQVLAQLDTEAIPPTAQTIELENILRDDAARPSLGQAEALSGAPEREGAYFRVPVIVEGGDGPTGRETAGSSDGAPGAEDAVGGDSPAVGGGAAGAEGAAGGRTPQGDNGATDAERAAGGRTPKGGETPQGGKG